MLFYICYGFCFPIFSFCGLLFYWILHAVCIFPLSFAPAPAWSLLICEALETGAFMFCAVTNIKVKALTDFVFLWVFRTVFDFELYFIHERNSFLVLLFVPSELLGFGHSFPIAEKWGNPAKIRGKNGSKEAVMCSMPVLFLASPLSIQQPLEFYP